MIIWNMIFRGKSSPRALADALSLEYKMILHAKGDITS